MGARKSRESFCGWERDGQLKLAARRGEYQIHHISATNHVEQKNSATALRRRVKSRYDLK
jgi:hypothetical protein